MKRITLLCTLFFCAFTDQKLCAQDFSNKGKDFWVAYGYHQQMTNTGNSPGGSQEMVLYFATEAVTTVTVSIPGLGYTQTYANIAANTVITSLPLPKTGAQDARLTTETGSPENKGIHIVSDKPIVAYAHIYNQSVSGATILFPTNTLGKEYYSINYENISNNNNSNCWFYVVACDTGTTTVEITPIKNTLTHPAGVTFSINLTQGQVYNMMGQYSGSSGVDLTGSKIQSIDAGNGCKRIGVFSGSGRISLTCDGSSSSSDNYMVQAFPKSAWGKRFLTAPTGGSSPRNFFRICVSDPATIVKLNGAVLPGPPTGNFYYQIGPTLAPNYIEADQPITVAQYLTSQGACGNTGVGDPEVIYLSPIEQNINKVLWNATSNFAIIEHYINAIIPNTGTAISSFKLDGVAVSPLLLIPHPQAPGYSYLRQSVTAGQHIIQSDSGFNAIAYGYGSVESYGYNAGTNIKDLFQFLMIRNQHATVNFPAACKNSPFFFSMVFPYQPTSIQWQFNGLFTDVTVPVPVSDSNWVVDGKTLYRYSLPTAYILPNTGTYPIHIVATNPTPDGCGNTQEIDLDLQVFENPTAEFNFTTNGCLSNPVAFQSNDQNTQGRPVIKYWWDFADAVNSTLQNPSHTYSVPGTYNVRHVILTDVGCISDTLSHPVAISIPPVADFNTATPICETRDIIFTNLSVANAGSLTTWRWNFGDGNSSVFNSASPFIHNYPVAGNYPVTLQVETNKGCISTVLSRNLIVNNRPKAGFISPEVCLIDPFAPFTDTSKIGGSGAITGWNWNFGDPGNAGNPNTSALQNPSHHYISTGSYTAILEVTSSQGCMDTIQQTFTVNGSTPVAGFTVNNNSVLCSNKDIIIKDGSSVDVGNIVKVEIYWDFANDPTIKTIDDLPTPGKLYTYTYPEFGTPFTKTFTVRYVAYSGINCVNSFTKTITLLATPTVRFSPVNAVCDNIPSFTISQAGITNGLPGNGIFTGTGVTANGVFDPATAASGLHTISYTYTGNNGCINTASQTIRVNPSPNTNAGPDKVVLEGGFVSLTPVLFANFPVSYLWTPATYLDNPILPAALVQQPADDITYTLRITTDQGCYNEDQVFVKVLKKPEIPNAFSPNGDGIHDNWEIAYLESYPGCIIDIYNRYGQLVYHSVNYTTPWNGKINGRDAPIGTYYYIIDPKNGRKPITGFVDIVR